MRLIDAGAVKDIIRGPLCVDTDADKGYVCERIDQIPTVGGWISVEDRLPEPGRNLLVWADGYAFGEYLEGALWRVNGIGMTHIVTYWIPLPEPPGGERDGN